MSHFLINDRDETVEITSRPNSKERAAQEWPGVIARLNQLWYQEAKLVDALNEVEVLASLSETEINNIIANTYYNRPVIKD